MTARWRPTELRLIGTHIPPVERIIRMASMNKVPGPDRQVILLAGRPGCTSIVGRKHRRSRKSHLRPTASNIEKYFCFDPGESRRAGRRRTGQDRDSFYRPGQVATEANGMLGKSAEETHRLSACRERSGRPDGRGLRISSIYKHRAGWCDISQSPSISILSRMRFDTRHVDQVIARIACEH